MPKHNFTHGPRTKCFSHEARLRGLYEKTYAPDWAISKEKKAAQRMQEMLAALEAHRAGKGGRS